MKLCFIILLLISFSGFGQKKSAPIPKVDTSLHIYNIAVTEEQMGNFFDIFQIARDNFLNTDYTGKQIKIAMAFVDSCKASWNTQYLKWHPAPVAPSIPKKDTVINKPDPQTKVDSTQKKRP